MPGRRARNSTNSALSASKPTDVIGIWVPRSLDLAIDPSYLELVEVNMAAFLGVSILVIITPGQDTALTIRNTLVGGRGAGVLTAAGVASGQFIWTVATSAGLAALIVASEPVFTALKLAGAAYLIFLGAQALYAALRPRGGDSRTNAMLPHRLRRIAAYRQGVLSNLGNPKMAVFFSRLLPQFITRGPASF